MHLAVLGSNGRTGREVVAAARARGHQVLALARRPPETSPPAGVTTRTVDLLDPAALAEALDGADAVISTVGPGAGRAETDLYSAGAAGLATAAAAGGPRRVVVVSAVPVAAPSDLPWGQRLARRALHAFFGGTYRDMARMETFLAASDLLAATAVRAPRLTGGPARGGVRAVPPGRAGLGSVSRADLARVLVALTESSGRVPPVVVLTRAYSERR